MSESADPEEIDAVLRAYNDAARRASSAMAAR